MSDDPDIERPPRVRPVADAPLDALLAQADELARRWAIELIIARPLAQLSEVPLGDLAREAPGLCAQVVRALRSDTELHRLIAGEQAGPRGAPASAHHLAVLARARDASACAEQVEALRGVLWDAIMSELRDPPVRLAVDLCDRLSFVCAAALVATLELRPAVNGQDAPRATPAADREPVPFSSQQAFRGRRGAVLIDELGAPASAAPVGPEPPAPPAVEAAQEGPRSMREHDEFQPGGESPRAGRPLPWDIPLRAEGPERRPPSGERAKGTSPTDQIRPDSADVGDPVMRVTRRPISPIDERS